MEPTTFVLFGATGDLAKRKIYPALYNLFIDQKLSTSFSVIGLGRRELSDETFQKSVEQSLIQFSRREVHVEHMKSFLQAFRYNVLNKSKRRLPEAASAGRTTGRRTGNSFEPYLLLVGWSGIFWYHRSEYQRKRTWVHTRLEAPVD